MSMTSSRRSTRRQPDNGKKAKFSQLLPYLADYKPALILAASISVVSAGMSLAQPLLTGQVIDAVQNQKPVAPLAAILVLLVIAAAFLNGFQYYLLTKTGEGVVRSSRRDLVNRILRLPVIEFDHRRIGDLVSRVGSDTTLLRAVLTQGLVDAVGGALLFAGAVIAMAIIDPVLLGLTLGVIVVAILGISTAARRIRFATTKAQERVGEMSAAVERAISAIRTIRAARAEEREATAIHEQAGRAYEQGVKIARLSAAITPIAQIAMNTSFILVLGVGGFRVASGATTIANLVTFVILLFFLIGPLIQAFGAYTSVQSALGALARIQEILDLPTETADEVSIGKRSGDSKIAIEFDSVSFTYPEKPAEFFEFSDGADGTVVAVAPQTGIASKTVLTDVSFKIEQGTRVALVGPSGAGKSTIFALIERFYEPTGGQIKLAGQPVTEFGRAELRSQIGYVEQDAPVLAGTIRDNLLLGKPDASDAELKKVLAEVNLTAVLKRDPAGLNAEVGESGIMLSGGERQRLAIARALLSAPPILLLDESTSALDGVNEQRMREAIDSVAKNRTLIVIAHRLSTVVDSDQIIVLEAGRVIGSGTHSELVKKVPLYKELAKHQLLV